MPPLQTFLTAGVCGAALCLATLAQAEQRPVVVELFTSQGCSSCPPADEMFDALSDREDVIAIAFHVDYWDYIGWEDEFGHPAHADRQRAYANAAGRRSIYTPEMLVNGETDIVGAKPMELSKAIARHMRSSPPVRLEVTRQGGALSIAARAGAGASGPYEVHMLRLIPSHTSEITRGENRGKSIEYVNIAHDWQMVDTWNGQGTFGHSVNVAGDDPVVVLVQTVGGGAIHAGAIVD